MAASFRFTGPACCCCKYTIRSNEQRVWCEEVGEGDSAYTYETPSDPTQPRELVYSLHFRPAATLDYWPGTMTPDWKHKRIYYSYIANDRPMGTIVDQDTVVKYSSGKTTGAAPGTTVTTLSSYLLDSMACDPDNEHIYFTGHDYPYPDYTAAWSIDFKRMNYDGTGVTTLLTDGLFRTGGGFGPRVGIGSMLVHRPLARLYYVKRHNYTTATTSDYSHDLCYRTFASFGTEVVIRSSPCFSSVAPRPAIDLMNCLSFDLTDEKIYWCEHYQEAGAGALRSYVYRANMDGSGLETLYHSAAPYRVNFARYSNQNGKIYHEDFDPTPPRDGFYERDKAAWGTFTQLATIFGDENYESPYPGPQASYLWCGYEGTGA